MSTSAAATGLRGALPTDNCFGCAPDNARGLHLQFEETGPGVRAAVRLGRDFESFPTTIHGGVVAAVLDEAMGRAAYRVTGEPAVTTGLRVRFIAPVRTGLRYDVEAAVVSKAEQRLKLRAELVDECGAPMATADATFVLVDESHFDAPEVRPAEAAAVGVPGATRRRSER